MKRLALGAVAAVTLAFALAAPALSENNADQPTHSGRSCTLIGFDTFAVQVWDQARWHRGMPPPSTLRAERRWLRCAQNPKTRHLMQHDWQELKTDYFAARSVRLLHKRIDPFYGCTVGGCAHWPIPTWSVNCESGGGAVADNLYGNLATYTPGMSKWEQDRAAHRLLVDNGGGQAAYEQVWLRWESGCTGYPGEGWY